MLYNSCGRVPMVFFYFLCMCVSVVARVLAKVTNSFFQGARPLPENQFDQKGWRSVCRMRPVLPAAMF